MRGHNPLTLEQFNGLWQRGDDEACPQDHFLTAKNLQYTQNGFKSRDPLDTYQDPGVALSGILRFHNYVMQSGESLLVLTIGGNIYHVVGSSIVYGPILTIPTMTDFNIVSIAGRAYITPFASTVNSFGVSSEIGLQNEYVYVYNGDGNPARKAAGFPPSNSGKKPFSAYISSETGVVTEGTHVVAVAYYTDKMGLLGPEIFAVVKSPASKKIQLANIPIGPTGTTKRVIAMTKVVDVATVSAVVSKTYSWDTDLDGWTDIGLASLAFGYEGTDHAVAFTGAIPADNDIAGRGISPAFVSWEDLGVPIGATVVGVRITGWKRKVVDDTHVGSAVLSADLVNSSGATICNVANALMPGGVDAVYTAMTPGSYIAVDGAYGDSSTLVRLALGLDVQADPVDTAHVDMRFDDITLEITYTRQVTSLYSGDQTLFNYYDALTIPDNVTVSTSLNVADANLTSLHTPDATPPAAPTTGALLVQSVDQDGYCDVGLHIFGVVYETDTGYLTAPGPEYLGVQTFIDGTKSVKISNIPVSPDSFVVKRHIVATRTISGYNGNQKDYDFFFIPNGVINDNTTTELVFSFYDNDLISDASHLFDNFAEIPAFVGLTTYQGRMVGYGEYDNISVARLSASGEPEAINQVNGLIIAPLDGFPLTNAQEYRDTLYLFKQTKTIAYVDNGDVPSSWKPNVIDQGNGASVHGIATVLDSGGINVDFLIIVNFSGVMIFNGVFSTPELTWKVADLWSSLDRNAFRYIQIVNDTINKKMWMTLPPAYQMQLLHADYANGLDPKNIRFALWEFSRDLYSIGLIDRGKLILGMPSSSMGMFDSTIFDPTMFDVGV